jgi:hypothetical protein
VKKLDPVQLLVVALLLAVIGLLVTGTYYLWRIMP